ncbi:uncharacterized protein LOC103356215 [Stegastes partitus]|uniref:Uncharacterized protein LOC103356215 n=1 Tax=Stegastes partitus TaxID=144197 RepID=A0A9Y4MWU1_9TELE|nr:PREDICTED: uncharacterized protein LOC103356215 [Stegastes partitus]
MKPADKAIDFSGKWRYIAISTEVCLATTLVDVFLWPSAEVDITAKDTPNIYNANVNYKVYGMCYNESLPLYYANHNVFNVDSNNAPIGQADVMLQTGCPDCLVVKGSDFMNTLTLFSKRKSVDAAEMKEFETQVECLGWSKPLVFNTDHDYENCKSLDDDTADVETMQSYFNEMSKRVTNMSHKLIRCIIEIILCQIITFFQK